MAQPFEPREYGIGEDHISRMGFYLVDENIRVQRNPPMTVKEAAEARQSQLSRSF